MSIEDRRNYWNPEEEDESLLRRVADYVVIIVVLVLVAGVFYAWGRKDGIEWTRKEACSTGAGRYYLQEVCE